MKPKTGELRFIKSLIEAAIYDANGMGMYYTSLFASLLLLNAYTFF
jgi:hypothetical protein